MKATLASLALLLASPWSAAESRVEPPGYHLAARHVLGGEGGWDYLSYEAGSNRLFITRGNRVQVVEPESGRLLDEIADTPGVHGVALAAALGKGYTSNGRDGSVTVFDLASLKTRSRITGVGDNPDFILFDPASQRVFAFNGRSHDVAVIDALSDSLVSRVAVGGKPEAAVADGAGRVYVNIEDRNQLVVLDAGTAKVVSTWELPGCDAPVGLDIDARDRRLFVACRNLALLVVDSASGRVTATLKIGAGVDATVFDAGTGLLINSLGEGSLALHQRQARDQYTALPNAPTAVGARTMAFNPKTRAIYLVTAEFETLPAEPGQTAPRRRAKPGSFTLLVMKPGPD